VIVGAVLDDLDSRSGSTTSLLRTIVGLYLRRVGGFMRTAHVVSLMDDLGFEATRTRTAIARQKNRGLLLADRSGDIGYRLNPDAVTMLERGDLRIFHIRQMSEGDSWCLISFSIPEELRDLRDQLRRRLQWIGCGPVAQGLWIGPDHLRGEVEEIVDAVGATPYTTTFRADAPRVAGALVDAAAQWWDLDSLRARHETFLREVGTSRSLPLGDDRGSFVAYVRMIDAWRVLPYVDPGLPANLLPADWPGQRSVDTFTALSEQLASGAWSHVRATVGDSTSRLAHVRP
jgi:phenylacetic acid degradation operon negative regulatory protein